MEEVRELDELVFLLSNPLSGFSLTSNNGWEGNYALASVLRTSSRSSSSNSIISGRTGGGGGFGFQLYCLDVEHSSEILIGTLGGGGGGGFDDYSIGGGGGGGGGVFGCFYLGGL